MVRDGETRINGVYGSYHLWNLVPKSRVRGDHYIRRKGKLTGYRLSPEHTAGPLWLGTL